VFKSEKSSKRVKMDCDKLRLVDIGNTHAKIYHKGRVEVVSSKDFDLKEEFFYISVYHDIAQKLSENNYATNLADFIELKTTYKGLGVDRKVLCSYIDDGVIVDAGSAITVDVMSGGYHEGGFILPGVSAFFKAYEDISPALKVQRAKTDISKLPKTTQEAINYATFKSVVLMVKDISKDKKIYFCGGDGEELSRYFEGSIYKKDLIFEAMKKIVREKIC